MKTILPHPVVGKWLWFVFVLGWVLSTAAAPTPQEIEFFETKIQPILINHCYKCHSEAGTRDGGKIKGGLRVDTREGLFKGGESGPVIVPGKPEASLLVKAVRYTDKDLQMPPSDRKLSDPQIADIEQWVKMGAPDPRNGPATQIDLYALEKANAARHWAFQLIDPPEPPSVADTNGWVQSPIDQYILADLLKNGIEPSKRADKTSLIRRASFDLTGLPPTPADVDKFIADDSPGAFTNVVNGLLDSPRYGERWGRYWLDLARYADTKGSGMDDRFVGSHTYRDYVIRAFNEDLPYDQFILQQIAADKLPGGSKKDFAALGFLTLGNRFNNNADDIIADRIDVVSKSTLALTMTCARCHDHKFDPIPTMDYYSWHGIFSSSYEPEEGVIIEGGETNKNTIAYQAELAKQTLQLEEFKKNARDQIKRKLIASGGSYLLALAEMERSTNALVRNNFLGSRGLNRRWADSWASAVKKAQTEHNRILAPWVELASFPEDEFAARAPGILVKYRANAEAGKTINPQVARLLTPSPESLKQLAARYSTMFGEVQKIWESSLKSAASRTNAPVGLVDANMEEIRQLFHNPGSPVYLPEALVDDMFNRDNQIRNRIRDMEKVMTNKKASHPGAPQRSVVLLDKPQAQDSYVHVRGSASSRGPNAPRRFLEILSPPNRPQFHDGSGRLELAKAIVSEDNPLTSRVMVNRIWQGHFGEGIVRTPNDFGVHSEKPSHPELLDYLAWTFIEDKWSIKTMHRRMMFSSAYQQSSEENPRYGQIDPGNRLLFRMNRRRLDFEALRDTILFIGGRIDLTVGGPGVALDSVPYSERRTVYGFVDRGKLSGMQRAFDFASPDLCVGKRDITTVPQQALFLMNSPLVFEQAFNLVRRPDFTVLTKSADRVKLLYRLVYQRAPTETELKLSLNYVGIEDLMPTVSAVGNSQWESGLGQWDPNSKRVRGFAPMSQFYNGAWRGAGGATLTAEGGHASAFSQTAVIRRWISPADGRVLIEGPLQHSGEGDGVQGVVVSSRLGMLGDGVAENSGVDITIRPFDVKEGDTVDFLVYCRADANGDDFIWHPVISLVDPADASAPPKIFEADAGFLKGSISPVKINAWQKFAQVLLETNELTFYN